MGLFSRNWDKPGPGVDKNAPQKNAFFAYFDLLRQRAWGLITQNLFFFLVTLPVIIYAYVLMYTIFTSVAPDLFTTADGELVVPPLASMFISVAAFLPEYVLMALVAVSLFFYGPFMMGLTYVMRNYVRDEHAWSSDFFSRAFSNFKQGVFFGVADILVVVIFSVNWSYINFTGSYVFGLIIRGLSVAILVFYLFIRNYAYQLAVTVNLTVRQIIKNSAIFALVGAGRNLLALVIDVAIVFVSLFLTTFLDLVMVPFVMFALMRFTTLYITYPIVDKYIVQPALEIERENAPDEDENSFDAEYEARLNRVRMLDLPPELGGPGAGNLNRSYDSDSDADSDADSDSGSADSGSADSED